ncbi:MAG: hypothetical protein IKF72_15220 [Kiritimatiellae bacterium]|nr:hypothetical protein [Kiritimatiellia bacterium]
MKRVLLSAAAALCVSASFAEVPRFYRTVRDGDGRWWFAGPDGGRFFLNGIGVVTHKGHHSAALGYSPYERTVKEKYPTLEDWATNTLCRLKSWGFNMLSSSSTNLLRRGMSHASVLAIGEHFSMSGEEYNILPCDGGPCTGFPNVFHPRWLGYCRHMARKCVESRDDPWVLGWYIDNELAWWGDRLKFRSPPSRGLFDACAAKPEGHSARAALDAFLKERGIVSPSDATEDVAREFVRLVARRYFENATRAIREADPNHLVLGCRFAGMRTSDRVVWEECGRYCDVVSANTYPLVDLDRGVALNGLDAKARQVAEEIAERAEWTDKPIIITEWSFVALDSGLPCMHGAGERFFTQRERAAATSIFAKTLYALPGCAGYVYYMWSDQPKVGKRGEKSENCNYGLVDANDNPWPDQVAALSEVQNNPAKWRYAPLPQDRPVVKPTAIAVAKAAATDGTGRAPEFSCGDDGTFELSNGLVRLSGRIGEPGVSLDGKGTFAASIREYSRGSMWWSVASEVTNVRGRVKNGLGVIEVVFRGKTSAGAFEIVDRLYLPQGRPFFLAELRDIMNRGSKALPVDAAFFRLLPLEVNEVAVAKGDADLEPPKDGQPTPIPPQLWRPWRTGAWVLPDGTCLALAAPRLAEVDIRFYKDSSLHSDAVWHCPYKTLSPGETFRPESRPFVLGGRCVGATALDGLFSEFSSARK